MADAATIKMTLNQAAEANLRTGVLLLCKEALVTAIQDRRLHRGHLRVLATVAHFMSSRTAKAWPGRAAIASVLAMPLKTVSNVLLELREFGYLIAEREAVEEASNRNLMVYTFGNIDHETIRKEITAFVESVRSARAPEPIRTEVKRVDSCESPVLAGQSRPGGTLSPAPAGLSAQMPHPEVPPQRDEKSRPGGYSNSCKDTQKKEGSKKATPADAGLSVESEFEIFWAAFPQGRKRGKGDALDAFRKIVTGKHKARKATAEAIIDGARRYAASKPDPEYVPLPETWLNGGRWMDELPAAPQRPWWEDAAQLAALTDERWNDGIDKYAGDTWPVGKLGPPPGSPLCVVPQKIIAARGLADLYDARGLRRRSVHA